MQDLQDCMAGGIDWDSDPLMEEIRNSRENYYGLDSTVHLAGFRGSIKMKI